MIVVDANLLLYAYDSSAAHHPRARRWLEDAFSGAEQVRLPWAVVLAFVRISTHPRVLSRPLPIAEATSIVDEWLGLPNVETLDPTDRHWEIIRDLMRDAQIRGPLVTDAHLAALAIEHGATLCTNDRDFRRFQGLRLAFPLVEPG